MARESDDNRRAREAEAISDFRSFLLSYWAAVSFISQGLSDEAAAPHILAAKEDGRAVLAHLLRRKPTEAEVERLFHRFNEATEHDRR